MDASLEAPGVVLGALGSFGGEDLLSLGGGDLGLFPGFCALSPDGGSGPLYDLNRRLSLPLSFLLLLY